MASSSQLIQRKNWFEDHPQFQVIQAMGYDEHHPYTSRSAMLVYLELCEAKHWFHVCIHPCDNLKRVYIKGRPRKKADVEVVVPLSVNTSLCVEDIQNIVTQINRCENNTEQSTTSQGVTLGICDSESSIVYYKVFNGLEQPGPPSLNEESSNDNNGNDTSTCRAPKRTKYDKDPTFL